MERGLLGPCREADPDYVGSAACMDRIVNGGLTTVSGLQPCATHHTAATVQLGGRA